MKTFKIFHHPTSGYQVVKVDLCWPAFFFLAIWASLSRLWGIACFILIASILATAYPFIIMDLIMIVIAIYVGLQGNLLRSKNLIKRGFEKVNVLQAGNKEAAIALHVKQSKSGE